MGLLPKPSACRGLPAVTVPPRSGVGSLRLTRWPRWSAAAAGRDFASLVIPALKRDFTVLQVLEFPWSCPSPNQSLSLSRQAWTDASPESCLPKRPGRSERQEQILHRSKGGFQGSRDSLSPWCPVGM